MSPRWRWFLLGYAWALLNTFIGLVLCIFYRAGDFAWHQGVLTCVARRARVIGQPGAQTWGWLVVYTDPRYRTEARAAELRVHEYTHVWQGFVLGPIFLLAYGLAFLWHYLRNPSAGWFVAYEANEFEVDAREQAVKPDGKWGV